jgi:hypothetical protein
MRLALGKREEGRNQEEKRRIHARRWARGINNIMVGWRDAQGEQRV